MVGQVATKGNLLDSHRAVVYSSSYIEVGASELLPVQLGESTGSALSR